ncbi:MAG: hypothetical protein WB711_17640, partial [Terriglobales bacterium]
MTIENRDRATPNQLADEIVRLLGDADSSTAQTALAGCGKTRFEAGGVPRTSLVSTAQPDKKEVCVDKTSSSWMC